MASVKGLAPCQCAVAAASYPDWDSGTGMRLFLMPRLYAGSMGLLDKLSVWLGRGRTEVTVLVLGLDNSGKSTLLAALRPPDPRQPAPHAAPTVGHAQDHFTSGGVSFSAWDVSGAARHRAL
ncbi:unnamed protein product [Spodoptera exigua]|nr:unnamed protein product [Spodoptera exigua]